jgi:3',5'-cyclic-AMP phosphodiesterase
VGNHDIWGWNKAKSMATGEEGAYGKAWACEMFAREKPYTSLDQGGWHIIILDSVQPDGDGYIGKLDDEQFAWLEQDLAAVDPATPVMVVSHIPIFTICVYNMGKREDGKNWNVPGSLMHIDAHRIRKLFLKHKNVKLCLSGHIHERDRIEFGGVTYICDGAVSGAWWKGRYQTCDEGYALLDLYPDGTFTHQYQTYGWVAKKS